MTPKIPKLGQPNRPARHSGRWSGYRHLLWVRILELKREPEVVFWVFIFPLLLAAGLGIAFRNKPAVKGSPIKVTSSPVNVANTAPAASMATAGSCRCRQKMA